MTKFLPSEFGRARARQHAENVKALNALRRQAEKYDARQTPKAPEPKEQA